MSKVTYDRDMRDAWDRCVTFNENHAVGSSVTWVDNNNTVKQGVIEAPAHALPNGDSVVKLVGVTHTINLGMVL